MRSQNCARRMVPAAQLRMTRNMTCCLPAMLSVGNSSFFEGRHLVEKSSGGIQHRKDPRSSGAFAKPQVERNQGFEFEPLEYGGVANLDRAVRSNQKAA